LTTEPVLTKRFIVNLKQLSTTSHHESETDNDIKPIDIYAVSFK